MYVGCCADCKYLDLIDEKTETTCPRCSGLMVSLDVTSEDWNKFDDEEMRVRIETAISKVKPAENSLPDIDDKTEDVTLPDYDEDYDETFEESPIETEDNVTYEFIEPNTSEESDMSAENTSDVSVPKIKKAETGNETIPKIKKKTVETSAPGTNSRKANVGSNANYGNGSVDTTPLVLLIRILAVIVALVLVILCFWRNSGLGGMMAIASIIIPFRRTFMNGYDMFDDTHVSLRYIIWAVLIVISLVGIITS